MEQFLSHFQEYLILGLLGALFFKESLLSFINARLGIGKSTQEKSNDVYQTQIDDIKKDINDIKTNHLFHIEADMVIVKESLAFIRGQLTK